MMGLTTWHSITNSAVIWISYPSRSKQTSKPSRWRCLHLNTQCSLYPKILSFPAMIIWSRCRSPEMTLSMWAFSLKPSHGTGCLIETGIRNGSNMMEISTMDKQPEPTKTHQLLSSLKIICSVSLVLRNWSHRARHWTPASITHLGIFLIGRLKSSL